ncbi:hypothetical protein N0V95_005087 [Ascochyta clinopodiicola]|nr:hypothetical protein N0V95_005087 [Ascochyta clinopodiicola]
MADFESWVNNNRGLWARVYDEVIAPDFEKEWKKREEEQKTELKQRDENQEVLFKYINQQIVKTAHLVEENERLETELQQRSESIAPSTTYEDATVTFPSDEDEHRKLAEKYDELSKKYQDLTQKVKYLERKNNAVMQKNRDMKDSVRAWQQYADRQKPNHKPKGPSRLDEGPSRLLAVPHNDEGLPHMSSSPRSVSTVRTPLLGADRGHSSPTPGVTLTDREAVHEAAAYEDEEHLPSASVTPKGPTVASLREPQDVSRGDFYPNAKSDRGGQLRTETTGAPSSSQTTVDEAADQVNRRTQKFDVEDEDDWPQIVSERSLKRKRAQQSRIDIYTGRSSDGTPAKPHRVKDEPLSSPPPAAHVLMRTETIDLDEPAPNNLEVPRAPQNPLLVHSNTASTFRHQRSSSAPFSQGASRDNTHRDHGDGVRGPISNIQARLQVAAAEMRALSEPMDQHSVDQHVLRSLDPNTLAPASEHSPNKRLKQAEARRVEHSLLAESGETLPPVDENELRLPPSAARARFNHRMRATKNPQTPARPLHRHPASGSPLVKQEQQPNPPTSTPGSAQTPSASKEPRRSSSNARVDQQHDIVPDGRPVWNMRASEKRSSAQKPSTSPSSMQSSLRTKPLRELKVHDFKPNPTYNQGYTYAFSEAVRKRSDRLCLPGCTNPQCCGSTFRRLAEALDPLSAIQEEALLEDYLGDAYSSVICTQISSDERTELVLQARTKKMAKDTGKHREAYERRRTPPGFWRVDFPTTQEQEDDRVRAKEQEAKTVQERWIEAQKKGGRWVFRDE